MIHEITMLLVKFRNEGKSLGMVKDRKELARQIAELYKDYVRLDEDQELPEPYPNRVSLCTDVQVDMLKANYRRVILK